MSSVEWSLSRARPAQPRGPAPVWPVLALCLVLAGCGSIAGDSCSVYHSETNDRVNDGNCDGGFLSAVNQRAVLFGGDSSPKLWTGEPARKGPVVDTTAINKAPASQAPVVGWVGSMRVEYAYDGAATGRDLTDLRNAGGKPDDRGERVTVNFDKVTIDQFLKQMLSGALGVNYVAPESLGGSISFRTEQPLPKNQVLQVVRDILARNGLTMKYLNGVYHIGRPELIASLEAVGNAGRSGEAVTRVIKIRRGSANEVVGFVRQVVPDYVQILPTNAPDSLLVRGPQMDVDKLGELIDVVSAGGLTEDRVAIIPLAHSAPDKVALQLNEFYRARIASAAESVTILPLEPQQALLVGASDRRLMDGVRALAAQIDRDLGEDVTLRVIPLENLSAEQTAEQLTAILGGGNGSAGGGRSGLAAARGPGEAGASGGRAGNQAPARPMPTVRPGQSGGGSDEDGGDMPAPGFAMGGAGGAGGSGPGGRGGTAPGSGGSSAGVVAGGGLGIRIAADTRNNTIMVYSNYSMFKRVREVLKALDVPQSQVVIEATVLEVDINDKLQYGVQWFLRGAGLLVRSAADPNVRDPGTAGGIVAATVSLGDDIKAGTVITALQSITSVKILSSPYLTVVDGSAARLQIGDQVPFASRTQSSNNLGTVTVTQEIEVRDTGIILEVTPRIRSNNSVLLSVNQSVSKAQNSALLGNTTPVISNRQLKSDVVVQSGHTALLGGLIQERTEKGEDGVPVLRTVPLVGNLFKTNSDNVQRVEMVVMITPRVIRQTSQIEGITRLLHGQLYPRNMENPARARP
ncbi:type II secretion system secretin GspD [Prosthecomicrobium sp. N25]|uniref:type II secretion system secretin GspD n=1 Tax=Prosthecomicrobium sp. N25 TaxID=3129254 RepID=UPI003076B875